MIPVNKIVWCALSIWCIESLSGCAVGPDYVRPVMVIPDRFQEGRDWKQAEPSDQTLHEPWWEAFGDAQLNTLVHELNRDNQTIAEAQAKYRQALALYAGAEAARYPTLEATARQARGSGEAKSTNTSSYQAKLAVSWEVDLWGKLRSAVLAGQANVEASAADLAAARLSAQAQFVATYLQWVVANIQKASLDQSVVSYQQQWEDTQRSFAAGAEMRTTVLEAQAQWSSTQAQAVAKGLQRDQWQHALAVWVGKSPAQLNLKLVKTLPRLPDVPLIVPSALLERRPDIATAERRVAVANAQIGVASTAYFPSLSLSASGGYRASHWVSWLSVPERFWSLGPQLATMILFDAGALRAKTAQAWAKYDETVAVYRQTVLKAFKEVEDHLASVRALQDELRLRQIAWKATTETETIVRNQYRAGAIAYLDVRVAEFSRQSSEREYYDTLSRYLVANVDLIRALGGGWSATAPGHLEKP